MTSAKLDAIVYPVRNVSAAASFYRDALGLEQRVIDGERYAAMAAGGIHMTLVGCEEDVTSGVAAACFRVPCVDDAVEAAVNVGAVVVSSASKGPHEVRATLKDPWDNPFVLYGPR